MSTAATGLGDAIANAVFKAFEALPKKSKPALQTNGVHTWVPLSGIVVSYDDSPTLECISLG